MVATFREVWAVLGEKERRHAGRVLLMVIALGILEMAGVASVMPFLVVATNSESIDALDVASARGASSLQGIAGDPNSLELIDALGWAYVTFGFTSSRSFLMALGITSIVMLVGGALFRLVTQYSMLNFVSMRRHSLAMRLFEVALKRPYHYFLDKHTSDISKSVLAESNEVVTNLMKPLVDLIAHGIIALLLTFLIVIVDWRVAVIVAGTLGGAYLAIYLSIRNRTQRQGRLRVELNRARFKRVQEALGGIKEVKLRNLEGFYSAQFEGPSRKFARVQATNAILAQVPKYLIEAVAFGVVLGIAVYFVASGVELGSVIPLLALYAVAGHRLMPALQNVYSGLVKVRFGMGALESVSQTLNDPAIDNTISVASQDELAPPLTLKSYIALNNVSFNYQNSKRPALHDVNLRLDANTSIGIVGPTGAGKTTLLDLLLGLLRPTDGQILVDGNDLWASGVRRWQKVVGYVPQAIYLTDKSVMENIAFGVPEAEIDRDAVERAVEAAQLEGLIHDLPHGLHTRVGERGVRLSGGQRQRIGIARALYGDPQLLVLDEGTSALDGITENAVMSAVASLARQKTIILVAHRLSTVRMCDQIVLLETGRVSMVGSYDELLLSSETFHTMATAGTVAPTPNARSTKVIL